MKFKEIYAIGILISLYFFGCSSGEYELEEKTINYTEKQLKYDTIKTSDNEIKNDVTKKDTTNGNQVITKNDNFTFIVQIGAFIEKNNFDRFFAASRMALGNDVYFTQINSLYKIRIGSYSNKAEALKMLEQVQKLGYLDAFVITVRNQN
jgi:cell division protein FtsN